MRNSNNYQTFYKDAIKNKKGYVTKDGMWAAIPSNGKKFAIVHNGIVEHFSKNLEYLKTLKEVTHHTNPDESDDIETSKLIETKPLAKWR
jgi:hypothetical protein